MLSNPGDFDRPVSKGGEAVANDCGAWDSSAGTCSPFFGIHLIPVFPLFQIVFL